MDPTYPFGSAPCSLCTEATVCRVALGDHLAPLCPACLALVRSDAPPLRPDPPAGEAPPASSRPVAGKP
jgi:hypothetical protein